MDAYQPRRSLANGHWMTLYSWGNPRYFPNLPKPVQRYFDVAPDARVVADCHWQARAWERRNCAHCDGGLKSATMMHPRSAWHFKN